MNFLRLADRWLNRLYVACGVIAAGFLVLLAVLVLASILTRLMGTYVGGITEFSGYAMAASSFFALAYTFRAGGHIRVAILRNALHGRARAAIELWCLAVGGFFACFLAYYVTRMTYVSWTYGDRSEGGDAIPIWIPQTAPAFGACVMAVCVVHSLIRVLAGVDDAIRTETAIGD
jgi:TRAP-type C4-dicarboxylate transport system permease small subunit